MFANRSRSSIALAAALALGLGLSACAHNTQNNLAAGYGAAGPGSVQEFNQTVGDRVFFTTDQTDLSSTAQATLDKQAAWLNHYNKYSFTIEGHADERGTREYNFALGERRAQAVHDYLVAKGVSAFAHEDDQLWQGAAGRGLRRHLLLVPEPSRRHGAQRGGRQLSSVCGPWRAETRRDLKSTDAARMDWSSEGNRDHSVTSLFRPSLVAAFVACLVVAAPAQAQFDIFHRQPAPPANIPGGGEGDPGDAAGLVLRVNRLEEALRQANGRIEELENAERRLEAQLQKFRQDVEYRFGDRSEGAPPEPDVAEAPLAPAQPGVPPRPRRSDAFDPNADPNAPGAPRPLGTTAPSAPLVRETPDAGPPLELGRGQPPAPPPASGPTVVGSGVAMLDQPREQFNAALAAFQAKQYPEAEAGFKAFLAANPDHRLTPDAIFYIGEILSSTLAPARGGRAISQGHDRLFQIVAGAGEHGAARPDSRSAWQFRRGLRDADRIRQALPDRLRLGEEARRA